MSAKSRSVPEGGQLVRRAELRRELIRHGALTAELIKKAEEALEQKMDERIKALTRPIIEAEPTPVPPAGLPFLSRLRRWIP